MLSSIRTSTPGVLAALETIARDQYRVDGLVGVFLCEYFLNLTSEM